MQNKRFAFHFKGYGREVHMSFGLTSWPSDCGSYLMSSAHITGVVPAEHKADFKKAFLRAIRVAMHQSAWRDEYRKVLISGPINYGTITVGKMLRFRFTKSKSAHGGKKFSYGIKEFNLSPRKTPKPSSKITLVSAESGTTSYMTADNPAVFAAFNKEEI